MKKLLLAIFCLAMVKISLANPGDVTTINTISPQNYPASFQYITRSTYVFVDTTTFSKNLSQTDLTVQHALQTLDQLTVGGGGGGSSGATADGLIVTSSANVSQFNISTTPVKLGIFLSNGHSSNTVLSTTNAQIQVSTAGTYFVGFNLISTGTGNYNFYCRIRVNGADTNPSISCQDTPSVRCLAFGQVSLSSGDIVSVYANTNSLAQSTITVTDAQLAAHTIGASGATGPQGPAGSGGSSVNVSPHSVLFSTGGTTISGNTGCQYDDSVSSITVLGDIQSGGAFRSIYAPTLFSGLAPFMASGSFPDSGASIYQKNTFGNLNSFWYVNNFGGSIPQEHGFRATEDSNGSHTRITSADAAFEMREGNWSMFNSNAVSANLWFGGFESGGLIAFANSTFTISNPVVLSTLTISRQLVDSVGSSGSNTQVLTKTATGPTWQASSGGGTSVSTNIVIVDVGCSGDGGGVVMSTGIRCGGMRFDYNATISSWTISDFTTIASSVTWDIYRTSNGAASWTPTSGASIVTGGTFPSLTNGFVNSSAPSSWTSTAIKAGDFLDFVITQASATKSNLTLTVVKSQ